MPLLHMETDLVRNTGHQLGIMSDYLAQNYQQLLQSIQSLSGSWQGSSRDFFVNEMNPILNQLTHLADAGGTLNQRLQNEVNEWEQVDNHFGSSSSGNIGNNSDLPISPSDQQRLENLENEYQSVVNQMYEESEEIKSLQKELELERQDMIDRGLGEAIDHIEILISLLTQPIEGIVDATIQSLENLTYSNDAIEWGFKNMKLADMNNTFNSIAASRYDSLEAIRIQINQIDPNWQPPSPFIHPGNGAGGGGAGAW